MVVQQTPSSEAVRPTRRAISPRLAIRTEVMGIVEGEELLRWRAWRAVMVRAKARVRDAGNIGIA